MYNDSIGQFIAAINEKYTPFKLRTIEIRKIRPPKTKIEKFVSVFGIKMTEGFIECKERYYKELGFGIREIRELDKNGNEISRNNLYFINQDLDLNLDSRAGCLAYSLGIPISQISGVKLEGEPVSKEVAYQYLMNKNL